MEGDMRMQEATAAKAEGGGRKWRVVMTNNNAEKTAKANIKPLGFETYLPMAISERPATPRRPKADIIRPLLRGYLFVRFDTRRDEWGELFTTIGIKGLLRAGGVPLSVGDNVVDAIRQREEAGLIKLSDPSDATKWTRGQGLKWIGPAADIDVIFDEMIDDNRAVVFFTFLGRTTRQVVTPLLLK